MYQGAGLTLGEGQQTVLHQMPESHAGDSEELGVLRGSHYKDIINTTTPMAWLTTLSRTDTALL